MAVFKNNTRLGVVKKEVTAGTAVSFAATDYDVRMRVLELSSLTVEMDDEASKFATGDHTMDEAIPGIKKAEISFNVKLAPGELDTSTSASSLPYGKLLETAGFVKTYAGDLLTSGKYTFTPGRAGDSTTASVAIIDVESGSSPKGIQYKIAGAMSSFSLGCEGTGKPWVANFKYQGKVDSVSELSAIPVYSDDDGLQTIGDKFLDTTVRITGVDAQTGLPTGTPIEFCTNSFALEAGTEMADIECQADASGILHSTIVARKPSIKLNPRLLKLSDWNFWSEINNVSLYKVEILGTHIEVVAPRCQIMSNTISDSNGYFRNDLMFRPLRNIAGSTQAEKEADYTISIDDVDVTA